MRNGRGPRDLPISSPTRAPRAPEPASRPSGSRAHASPPPEPRSLSARWCPAAAGAPCAMRARKTVVETRGRGSPSSAHQRCRALIVSRALRDLFRTRVQRLACTFREKRAVGGWCVQVRRRSGRAPLRTHPSSRSRRAMHPAGILSPVATCGGATRRGPARGCVRQVSARSAVGSAAPHAPVAPRGRFRALPRVRRAPPSRAASADAEPPASEPGAFPGAVSVGAAEEEEDAPVADIEIPEKPTHVRIHDDFLPLAKETPGSAESLRAVFDAHFDDPRRTHEYRFVWDYWHVPNQYTLLRTPAADYFPKQDFAALERRLRVYAKDELGCAGVTPVWLSCYVEGMRQELHADVPHGPWAFVLSLTHWDERTWTGGETLILKPQTLDYWSNFDADAVVESVVVVAPRLASRPRARACAVTRARARPIARRDSLGATVERRRGRACERSSRARDERPGTFSGWWLGGWGRPDGSSLTGH